MILLSSEPPRGERIIAIAMLSAPLIGGCVMHQKKVMHTLENPAPVKCLLD